jgi:hypothetical protein
MKTLPFLTLGLVSLKLLAQAPDIGTYPATAWASTNLLINRALEAGQVGQVIGFTGPGQVGVTTGGGGGGAPNAVLWYADKTMLPSGAAYGTVAIVTDRQAVPVAYQFSPQLMGVTITNLTIYDVTLWAAEQTQPPMAAFVTPREVENELYYYTLGVGTANVRHIAYVGDLSLAGATYRIESLQYTATAPVSLYAEALFTSVTYLTDTNVVENTTSAYEAFEGVAKGNKCLGYGHYGRGANLYMSGFSYTLLSNPALVGAVVRETGIWIPTTFTDAPSDGQTYARQNNTWLPITVPTGGGGLTSTEVFIDANEDTFPITHDYVYFTYPPGSWSLVGPNVLADGVDGQVITLLNENNANDPYSVGISDDVNGTDGIGSNIDTGASALTMQGRKFYTFTFSAASSLWVNSGVGLLTLPAPWPAPDANGVQLLPRHIKDQLLIELVPWLLSESSRIFTNGIPGTATNPIVVP